MQQRVGSELSEYNNDFDDCEQKINDEEVAELQPLKLFLLKLVEGGSKKRIFSRFSKKIRYF